MATVDSGRLNNNKLEIARLVCNLKEKYPELPDDAVQDLVIRFNGNESGIDDHILQFRSSTAVSTSSTNNYPTVSLNNTTNEVNDHSYDAHTPEATYSRDRICSEVAPPPFGHQEQDPRLTASYPWYPQQHRVPSPRPNYDTNASNDQFFNNYNRIQSGHDPFQTRQEQQLSAFQTSFNSSGSSLSEYFTGATQLSDLHNSPNYDATRRQIDLHGDRSNRTSNFDLHNQTDRLIMLPSLHPDQSLDLDHSIHRTTDTQQRQRQERLRQQNIRFHNISRTHNSLSEEVDRVRTELSTAEKRILGNENARNPTQNDIMVLIEKTSMLRGEVQLMMDELDKFGDTAPLGADDEPNQNIATATPTEASSDSHSPSKPAPPRPPPLLPQYSSGAVAPPSYDQRMMYPLVAQTALSVLNADLPPRYNELPPGPCDHVNIGGAAADSTSGVSPGAQGQCNQSISGEESEVDGKWNCPRCTFSNHIALPECEVCEWKRT